MSDMKSLEGLRITPRGRFVRDTALLVIGAILLVSFLIWCDNVGLRLHCQALVKGHYSSTQIKAECAQEFWPVGK